MKHFLTSIPGGIFAFVIISCSLPTSSTNSLIEGIYVFEGRFPVINFERDDTIGWRTIRDTIFVAYARDEYLIVNRKWQKNSYDSSGWTNMRHADARPLEKFSANFNEATKSLRPIRSGGVEFFFNDGFSQLTSATGQNYSKATSPIMNDD